MSPFASARRHAELLLEQQPWRSGAAVAAEAARVALTGRSDEVSGESPDVTARVLALAARLEEALDLHRRRPVLPPLAVLEAVRAFV